MSIYDYEVKTIKGETTTLREYEGKVLLIVNTASQCGFAPQFKGLQKLHETYYDQGFEVLGFPSNQFREQEPGNDAEIESVCELNFGVRFPLYSKIDVNGPAAHPLFQYLTDRARGVMMSRSIKWNFTKFLIDKKGNVIQRFSPTTKPEKIESRIQSLLQEV